MTTQAHTEDTRRLLVSLFSVVLAGVPGLIQPIASSGTASTACMERAAPMGCSLLVVMGVAGSKKILFSLSVFAKMAK